MNEALLEKIIQCPRLPSLPTIAIEVIDLCRRPDINIKQIADTISNDPALSTKILRTVNSSYYGLSGSIGTISHALVILGLNTVKTLALGFSLVSSFKDAFGEEYDPMLFWRRSLYAAVGARSTCQRVGILEHEEAFLAGLLQDVGVMAAIQSMGREYIELLNKIGEDHRKLCAAERELFDLDHPVIGATLATQWKLPPLLVEPIRNHECPDAAPEDLRPMVRAVCLGGKIADVLICQETAQNLEELRELSMQWFKISPEGLQELLETVSKATREMGKLFNISPGRVREVGQILAEANETLLQLSMESQHNANALKEKNKQLQIQATTDPLTGAANRGRFNEFIRAGFDTATKSGNPLSIIFMDADKFKNFNDTYGHAAGDAVLVTIAKVLKANAPAGALVARYGGEEFAVVLPNMPRKDAAQLAERIRRSMEKQDVVIDDKVLHVTLSEGVASYEGGKVFKSAEQLVKAADQAVYAAKASGRNCVRVFAPRDPAAVPTPAPAAKA